jgi:predicted MPP superfamily phosphohydrolase
MSRSAWIMGTLPAAGALALAVHSVVVAPRELRIYRRQVRLPRLPAGVHDYRILDLSDLHFGGLSPGSDQGWPRPRCVRTWWWLPAT